MKKHRVSYPPQGHTAISVGVYVCCVCLSSYHAVFLLSHHHLLDSLTHHITTTHTTQSGQGHTQHTALSLVYELPPIASPFLRLSPLYSDCAVTSLRWCSRAAACALSLLSAPMNSCSRASLSSVLPNKALPRTRRCAAYTHTHHHTTYRQRQ